jgi:hypothetical protein
MAVSTVGRAPLTAYAQESSRAEASLASVRARVVTTEAGISLGKFGITYRSRDIELLPDDSGSCSQSSPLRTFSRSESFASVLEAASLSCQMLDAFPATASSTSCDPCATRPYAAAAYAAASRSGVTPFAPRRLLATV